MSQASEDLTIACGVRITLVFRAAFTANPVFDMHVLSGP
jgi:hypothetical protein